MKTDDLVWNQVQRQIDYQGMHQVREQAMSRVRFQISRPVINQVWDQVRAQKELINKYIN